MAIDRNYIIQNRDYTLIIDKSGSMSTKDQQGNRSRWDMIKESTFAIANKCGEFDPDGITIYTFSTGFKRYDNVTASKVEQIFMENEPSGDTEMTEVLQDALQNYFQRRDRGIAKANGETILVVTDGQPDNRQAVVTTIIQASQKISRDEELAISFIQIGDDREATVFLRLLDDELKGMGAKFDIVDTVNIEQIKRGGISLKEVLINAIFD